MRGLRMDAFVSHLPQIDGRSDCTADAGLAAGRIIVAFPSILLPNEKGLPRPGDGSPSGPLWLERR
jgi:hypothetical protein